MSELTTFIPAGGLGSRLRPHTFDMPKPLLPMGSAERRVIDHPLEISVPDSDHVWVSTDYLGEQLQEYLDGRNKVTTLRDSATVGSAGSLFEHYHMITDIDSEGDILVLPSDHIYENFSIASLWRHHRRAEADITLLTVAPKPYGEYVTTANDTVQTVEKRSLLPDALSTTGIFMLRNQYLVNWLVEARRSGIEYEECNIYHDIICPAVGKAAVHSYHLADGFWEDTGTPERYLSANMRISGNQNVVASTAYVDPVASIERCVVLDGSVVDASVTIKNAILSPRGITHVGVESMEAA